MCDFYRLYHIESNFEIIVLLIASRDLEGLGR